MTLPRSIRRRALLKAGLAGTASLTLPLAAVAAPAYGLQPLEVAQGVWLIPGAQESFHRSNGGAIANTVLLGTKAGAIVIDTGSTALMGAEIRSFADQRLGGLAATMITHHHPDHWFGNAAFADRPILSLEATAGAAATNALGYSDALYALLGPWMSGTTPVPPNGIAQPGHQTIGGRALTLLPLKGHTQADLVVLDEPSGTLIAGDLLFLDRTPSLPDADIAAWQASLDSLATLHASGTIPGHGAHHSSCAAIAQTRAYLAATHERLTTAAELGLTPAEAIAAGPVPDFADLGANPEEYHRSVVQRWSDYEMRALERIDGA